MRPRQIKSIRVDLNRLDSVLGISSVRIGGLSQSIGRLSVSGENIEAVKDP